MPTVEPSSNEPISVLLSFLLRRLPHLYFLLLSYGTKIRVSESQILFLLLLRQRRRHRQRRQHRRHGRKCFASLTNKARHELNFAANIFFHTCAKSIDKLVRYSWSKIQSIGLKRGSFLQEMRLSEWC